MPECHKTSVASEVRLIRFKLTVSWCSVLRKCICPEKKLPIDDEKLNLLVGRRWRRWGREQFCKAKEVEEVKVVKEEESKSCCIGWRGHTGLVSNGKTLRCVRYCCYVLLRVIDSCLCQCNGEHFVICFDNVIVTLMDSIIHCSSRHTDGCLILDDTDTTL